MLFSSQSVWVWLLILDAKLCNYSPKEGWRLKVWRNSNDSELTTLTDLPLHVWRKWGNLDERYRIWWIPSSKRQLSVSLLKTIHVGGENFGGWLGKQIWDTKVACFIWLAARQSCLTHKDSINGCYCVAGLI